MLRPEQKAKDVEFLNNPGRWPMWPICPMKKYESGKIMEFGIVVPAKESGKLVFIKNVTLYMEKDLKDLPMRIVTPQELIDEGWEVD